MKIKNMLPKLVAIFSAILIMASCEQDISTIGSEIIGDQNVNATLDDTKTVRAYSRKLSPVQSNELSIYQLGRYEDPVFGNSTANLLSQLIIEADDLNPEFDFFPKMDSVVLTIPYFNESSTDTDGITTYVLDSVYGNDPINIEIFESGYFLRDFDPSLGIEESQNYYTNQNDLFEPYQGKLLHTITDFVPSNDAIVTVVRPGPDDNGDEVDPEITESAPGLRVKLPRKFWKELIFSREGTPDLSNNNNFKEYFRGLYFKVKATTGDNLIKFDLSEASIDLHYSDQTDSDPPSETIERFEDVINLKFEGVNVNTFENELSSSIDTALNNTDIVNGEERLYVRGGEGIITVLDLFGPDTDGNGVPNEIDQMRQDEWLINEANLIFYVDKDQVSGGEKEPERLQLYDLKNGSVLQDYSLDITRENTAIDAYTTHFGRLERDSDGKGDYYKIRITNYLSDLIHNDSTNVALGLVVSQNVQEYDNNDLILPIFNDAQITEEEMEVIDVEVPANTVSAHEGTVLFGNAAQNAERRLKLQIYYTEPN